MWVLGARLRPPALCAVRRAAPRLPWEAHSRPASGGAAAAEGPKSRRGDLPWAHSGAASGEGRMRATKVTVPPEEISYSVVIHEYSKKGDVRGAAKWLTEMASSPWKPNVFVFNAVIIGFARQSDVDEAAAWLDKMIASGLQPNVFSYNAVIDTCAMRGDSKGAAEWFEKMILSGITPNEVTYNVVINSCSKAGDAEGAIRWLGRMRDEHTPDVISFNSAINACARVEPRYASQAERLVLEMRSLGIHPTEATWRALTGAVGERRGQELRAEYEEALRKGGVRQPTVPKRFREPEGDPGNRRRRPAGTAMTGAAPS